MKVLHGKPGLISRRCKTLWGLCYGGFKGLAEYEHGAQYCEIDCFFNFNFGSCT